MRNRTGILLLFVTLGAPACGGASGTDFSGTPITSGGSGGTSGASGGQGGSMASGGSAEQGGSGGSATGGSDTTGGTGGTDAGGTGGDATGGSGAMGGSSTGGTGGDAVGGTDATGGTAGDAMGGSAGNAMGGSASASGGMSGSGGATDCATLEMQYQTALEEALACNANSGKDQCTLAVRSSLGCGCDVYVNPDNEAAVAKLQQLGKQAGTHCVTPCPAIACVNSGAGSCTEVPDSSQGRCMTAHGGAL